MSADPNSPEALFAAAQDEARQQGLLKGRLASLDHCRISKTSYVLNDHQGKFIARLPTARVQHVAKLRHHLLMNIAGLQEVASIHPVRQVDRRIAFSKQPDKMRALAWAISEGRRVPQGSFSRQDWIIGLLLLVLGVIPGVIYLLWAWQRHCQYQADLKALVLRWRGLHRPEPNAEWFQSLGERTPRSQR